MRRPSLARRLLGTSLVALLLILAVGGLALSHAFRRSAEAAFDVRLVGWSDALVSSLGVDGGNVVLERPLGDPRFQRAFSGWYWVVGDEREPLLASASLWDANLRVGEVLQEEPGADSARIHRAVGPRDQELRAFVQEITLPRRVVPLRVVVAGDVAELRGQTERFDALLWASLAALGGALLAVAAIQMRLTLRPLRSLAEDLRQVRQGRRDRVDRDAPQELAPLVDAVNDLLAHDAALVERARTQAADLAHALKTPLSLVVAEASEQTDDRARRIVAHAETMRRHIDRRLGGAAVRPAVAGERTPLHAAVEGIVQTLARLHPTREIELHAPAELVFPGPREDLEEIAGNLLENACKWARHRVRFRAREADGRLELSVDDDGPGLEPAQREQVLERGARLDTHTPGAGLGLGIVCDVAASYRGSLRLDRSELGGLHAVVMLPGSC